MMKKEYPKHIKIIEGVDYNVKIISGFRTYTKIPKEIKFENKMVNDDNQDFCGGWSIPGKDLSNLAVLQRVIEGKKPFANLIIDKIQTDTYVKIIESNGLDYYVDLGPHEYFKGDFITVCRNGKLGDIFDLKTLEEDYKNSGIYIYIEKYKDKKLSDFLRSYDIDENPMWVTGLILGYPVENTISLCLEDYDCEEK